MAKIKVHELAKELEIKSKDVITFYRKRAWTLKQRRAQSRAMQ